MGDGVANFVESEGVNMALSVLLSPTAGGRMEARLAWAEAGLRNAFLKGYSVTGPPFDPALLQRLRLWSALGLWYNYVMVQKLGMVRRWYLNRCFSGLVRRLLKAESISDRGR